LQQSSLLQNKMMQANIYFETCFTANTDQMIIMCHISDNDVYDEI